MLWNGVAAVFVDLTLSELLSPAGPHPHQSSRAGAFFLK
jgi:hypothetical protein